ncbi:MAG: hypothetical protein GY861_10625 [bacterium]|nr:hypothetical protein [bacterium]
MVQSKSIRLGMQKEEMIKRQTIAILLGFAGLSTSGKECWKKIFQLSFAHGFLWSSWDGDGRRVHFAKLVV